MQYRTELEATITKQNEARFTPGPWEWSTSNSWRRLSSRGNDGNVMYPTYDRHDNHPNLEFPNGGFEGPDAHLLAAAPEMYAALKACQLQLLQSGDHHEYTEQALNLAETAIRKAEGK